MSLYFVIIKTREDRIMRIMFLTIFVLTKGSTPQASKASTPNASNAQPVSPLVHKSPKPREMVTNVVLGLVAAVGSSSKKRKQWYVSPPKDLMSPP